MSGFVFLLGDAWFRLVGPQRGVEIFGIRMVGINADNGKKLLFTLLFIVAIRLLRRLLIGAAELVLHRHHNERVRFWTRQVIRLLLAVFLVIGLASIWFNDPARLATAAALVTAGLAFALQSVVTALAGYMVILRGKTFNVGDRITMGGVRGDVVALGFLQTTIMEMGQPPAVQNADPAMWVKSRQYTGRLVTISNAKIFSEPVYNYTRDFPYIWEEMTIPVSYKHDRHKAEQIMLAAAEKHTLKIAELAEETIKELERRFVLRRAEIRPHVFLRMTDNWVELTVRFLCHDYGIRDVKDVMSREILGRFEDEKLEVASATFEVVGLPPTALTRTPAKEQAEGNTVR